MMFTLPTGGYDPRKHHSHLEAAQAELSEEVLPASADICHGGNCDVVLCQWHRTVAFISHADNSRMLQAHLHGGQWLELLDAEHPGIAEVKWCRNRFRPFLCIDPQVDSPSQYPTVSA